MVNGLEALEVMDYPGRLIIAGKDESGEDVVIYGLSGRSPSSQARRLKANEGGTTIAIDVTDKEQLAKGNPALLVYNAIVKDPESGAIIVSNGAQTDLIVTNVGMVEPRHILDKSLPYSFADRNLVEGTDIDMSTYEPDGPIFTPRVSGIVFESNAMLAVVKRGYEGEPVKSFTQLPLEPGLGYMIATYDGANPEKPGIVPSFTGEPRVVKLTGEPEDIANAVYAAIGEFAVSAACMTIDGRYAIKNLHGDGD